MVDSHESDKFKSILSLRLIFAMPNKFKIQKRNLSARHQPPKSFSRTICGMIVKKNMWGYLPLPLEFCILSLLVYQSIFLLSSSSSERVDSIACELRHVIVFIFFLLFVFIFCLGILFLNYIDDFRL